VRNEVTDLMSGQRVPMVLGCGPMRQENAPAARLCLDAFYEEGGRVLDTARVYGSSEQVVGAWIAAHGLEGQIRVITKGGHPDDSWRSRLTTADILSDAEASVTALRVRSLDCFLLHRDDQGVPVQEIASCLVRLIDEGICLEIGVSNWAAPRVAALSAALQEFGTHRLSSVSNYFGLAVPSQPPTWPGVRSVDVELLEAAEPLGLRVFGWSALSAGYFSGHEIPDHEFVSMINARRRRLLTGIARSAGTEDSAVLARWLTTADPQITPIMRSLNPVHVAQLCHAARDSSLDPSVDSLIDAVAGTQTGRSRRLLLSPEATW
jgi:aryl-alcohol dehydrogenase-like predicted oxidoreductase